MSIKLHGHPQLDVYPSRAACLTYGAHVNWSPGEFPVASPVGSDRIMDIVALRLGNSKFGHMHLNLIRCPMYAEVTEPFACDFSVVVFNAQGEALVGPTNQSGIRDMIFNDPVTGTPLPPGVRPVMRADIGVEKTYTGTLIFDPTLPQQFGTLHGWWNPFFTGEFRYDNGDHFEKSLLPSFFSMIDTSQKESDGVPFVSARVSPHSDTRHTDFTEGWGEQIVETLRGTVQWLPVRALKPGEVHRVTIATAGYGADPALLPKATAEWRRDSKIHEHDGGIVELTFEEHGTINLDCVFDADTLGPGTHPSIAGRRQAGLPHDDGSVDGNVIQLTFSVPVEGTVPPPQTVTVPNVIGKTHKAAVSALSAVGLMAMFTAKHDPAPVGIVLSQTPAAGASVAPGSMVDLVESSGPDVPPAGETWEVVPTVIKRLHVPGGLDRFRLCVVVDETKPFECVELVVKPDPED